MVVIETNEELESKEYCVENFKDQEDFFKDQEDCFEDQMDCIENQEDCIEYTNVRDLPMTKHVHNPLTEHEEIVQENKLDRTKTHGVIYSWLIKEAPKATPIICKSSQHYFGIFGTTFNKEEEGCSELKEQHHLMSESVLDKSIIILDQSVHGSTTSLDQYHLGSTKLPAFRSTSFQAESLDQFPFQTTTLSIILLPRTQLYLIQPQPARSSLDHPNSSLGKTHSRSNNPSLHQSLYHFGAYHLECLKTFGSTKGKTMGIKIHLVVNKLLKWEILKLVPMHHTYLPKLSRYKEDHNNQTTTHNKHQGNSIISNFQVTNMLCFCVDILDLRSNPFEEGGNDEDMKLQTSQNLHSNFKGKENSSGLHLAWKRA